MAATAGTAGTGGAMAATARETAWTGAATAAMAGETAPTAAAMAATAGSAPPRGPRKGPLVLDRYRLLRRLGGGAFGSVWLARDQRLQRDVAVKIVDRSRVGRRFEREARVAARLSHPAIVCLYEAAIDDQGAYLVSELVRGATLDRLLDAGALSDADIAEVAIALCDALEHAHERGVVHRDVKPSNILVPQVGAGSAAAKLTDFGVSSAAGDDGLTATGDVVGTLAYMAPEQAAGLEAGPAADLYALAVVVYEAFAELNPLREPGAARARRLGMRLTPLRRHRRDLPAELAAAVDRALRPRPEQRGTLADLRVTLERCLPRLDDEPREPRPRRPHLSAAALLERERPPASPGPWDAGGWPQFGADWDAGGQPRSGADWDAGGQPRSAASVPARAPGGGSQAAAAVGPPWLARCIGAAAAAGIAAWVCSMGLGGAAPGAIAALAAALALLAAPRLGWGLLCAALCALALADGRPGAALVIAPALLFPVLLAPAAPAIWPLAAAAPALGLLGIPGLAGAWPALAARAPGPWRRVVLGATGWVWLALAGAMTGRTLYLAGTPGVPGPVTLASSPSAVAAGLGAALVRSGALAPALVWAAASVCAPYLVRGRWPALDVIRVLAWAAITPVAVAASIAFSHLGSPAGAPPGAAVGAAAAGAIAIAPVAVRRWRSALSSSGAPPGLP